jgi:two-component system, sensor histidine kinase and response regulator
VHPPDDRSLRGPGRPALAGAEPHGPASEAVSQTLLREIIDAAPFGAHFYELRPDGRLIFTGFNKQSGPLLGARGPALIGLPIEEAFPGLAHTPIPDAYRRVATSGEPLEMGTVVYDRDGIRGTFEIHAIQTGIDRMTVFFRDVSAERRAQEDLRQQAAMLRAILDGSRQMVFVLDRRGCIVELNRLARERAAVLFGRELRIGDSLPLEDLAPAGEMFRDRFARALAGEEVTIEREVRRKDGGTAWYAFDCYPVRTDAGEILGVCVSGADVTGRRVTEDALRHSELRYRTLYLNTPVMLHSIDPEGRIVSVSNFWLEKLGYSRDEVVGHKSTEFLTPESRRLAREVVLPEFYTTGVCRDVPYEFVARDGAVLEVLLSAIAERDEAGRVVRSLAVIVDVTERNRSQRELAEARDEAVRAAEMKAEFLATMSHEIRTPLGGIIGTTELLLESGLSAEQRGFVLMALQSAHSLVGILNDTLDYSKMEAGRLELESVLFEPRAMMDEAAELMAAPAQGKGVELYCRFDGRIPGQVRGDPGRLRQVLANLVGNAIKFTPAGEVEIRAQLEQRRSAEAVIRFSVRDTGVGISPESAGQLFRKFSQGDRTVARRFGGTGLGLSICRQLVELMGGDIGVENTEGKGSIFWFRVPLAVNEVHAGRARQEERGAGRARVLAAVPVVGALAALVEDLVNLGMEASGVMDASGAVAELRRCAHEGRPFQFLCLDDRLAGPSGELPAPIAEMTRHAGLRLVWLSGLRATAPAALDQTCPRLTRPVRLSELRSSLQQVQQPVGEGVPGGGAGVGRGRGSR